MGDQNRDAFFHVKADTLGRYAIDVVLSVAGNAVSFVTLDTEAVSAEAEHPATTAKTGRGSHYREVTRVRVEVDIVHTPNRELTREFRGGIEMERERGFRHGHTRDDGFGIGM